MNTHAQAMVLASFLGDSLALGAHWIYDTQKIENQFGRIEQLLAPAPDSYHPKRSRGEFTHYGDQSLLLLKTLAIHKKYDPLVFADAWRRFISTYDGYLDKASKDTLQAMTEGKDLTGSGSGSSDLGGPARMAPLVFLYQNKLEALLQAVDSATRITHTSPSVIAGARFIARLAHAALEGKPPTETVNDLLDEGVTDIDLDLKLRRSLETLTQDSKAVIAAFGQHCGIVSALPGAVHCILKYQDNLREALIENVMAGGDSAARGMVIGMILGAHLGMDALPQDWLGAMKGTHEITGHLEVLADVINS